VIDEELSIGLKILAKIRAHQAHEDEHGSCKLIKIQAISSEISCTKLHNKSRGEDLHIVGA
jgi:hypothetical protein